MYEFFFGLIIYIVLVCLFLYFCIKYEKRRTEEDIISDPKSDLEKQVHNSFLKLSQTERRRVLEKVLNKNTGKYSQSSICPQSDDVSIIRNDTIKKHNTSFSFSCLHIIFLSWCLPGREANNSWPQEICISECNQLKLWHIYQPVEQL